MTDPVKVPAHIAIVMDGNGRWARKRFLPRIAGHRQGVEVLKRTVKSCAQMGIQILTVFAFSSENWKRPQEEVSGLMDIMVKALSREVPQLAVDGVRLSFLGDKTFIPESLRSALLEAEQRTSHNQRLQLNVCFNYGGRWDVVAAANALVSKGELITEKSLSDQLSTRQVGDPDLIIRTGGEMRLSNFLLWQAAYSELFFSDLLWPDFDEIALREAVDVFLARERRFGMTSEQLPQQA